MKYDGSRNVPGLDDRDMVQINERGLKPRDYKPDLALSKTTRARHEKSGVMARM
jgi:hypothetical protein